MRLNNQHIPLASSQSGNVFVFIFLGVVLFAALVFTISSGLNTGTGKVTTAQARNQATDIITYAQQVERAVRRVYDRGVSENDISFENPAVTGYDHSPVVPAKAQVFNASEGGRLTWRKPMKGSSKTASDYIYTGDIITTISSSGNDLSELVMILPGISSDLCNELNRLAGNTLAQTTDVIQFSKFTGLFLDDPLSSISAEKPYGCHRDYIGELGHLFFYYVIFIR